MATSDSSAYDCPICSDFFLSPKLLQCGHTVCRGCLLTWAKTSAVCPLCKDNLCQSSGQPHQWEAVVNALPDDVAMATLADTARLLGQHKLCSGCQQKGDYFCRDCPDILCGTCYSVHINLRESRHHMVVELSKMATAESLVTQLRARCASHQDRVADLFCPAHNEALCSTCASAQHRDCPNVEDFQQHADRLTDQLSRLKCKLIHTAERLRLENLLMTEQFENVETENARELGLVQSTHDSLVQEIEKTRKTFSEAILRSSDEAKRAIEHKKWSINKILSPLCAHVGVTERFESTSPGKLGDAVAAIGPRVESLCQAAAGEEATATSLTTVVVNTQVLAGIKRQVKSVLAEQSISLGPVESRFAEQLMFSGPEGQRTFCQVKDVSLSNGSRTAKWDGGVSTLALVSSPMAPKTLCEVTVCTVDHSRAGALWCGLTDVSPTSAGSDPSLVLCDLNSRVAFCGWAGYTLKDDYGCDALRELPEGSRVGMSLGDRILRLCVDREMKAEAPCYMTHAHAFFRLDAKYREYTITSTTGLSQE